MDTKIEELSFDELEDDGFMLKGHYEYGKEFLIRIGGGLWLRVIARTRTTDTNGSKFTHFYIVK